MYFPKFFKVTNINETLESMQETSFATLVTTKKGKPISSHLPLQLHKQGEDYYITGHMAYGNPQWRNYTSAISN